MIAGGLLEVGGPNGPAMLAMAPKARLVTYKVLADNGSGYDAWILKAIDHIWKQNQERTTAEYPRGEPEPGRSLRSGQLRLR